MKDIKVSVIMPVYNAAEYLSRTLDDVTNQTLRDIQIICVDDGSKDNSREIVKEYQKKDERIQLVEQENKNAGAARNHGMQYAKGKYVVFWDSDDLFLENALETMYLQAEKTQADICICAARRYDNQTGNISHPMLICAWITCRKKKSFKRLIFRIIFLIWQLMYHGIRCFYEALL